MKSVAIKNAEQQQAEGPAGKQSFRKETKKSFTEFCDAIKHVLIESHGTPPLVADAVIAGDHEFLQEDYSSWEGKPEVILDIAKEMVLQPRSKQRTWVSLEENSLVIPLNTRVKQILESFATTGLYGETLEEVVKVMITKGIESSSDMLKFSSHAR